MIRWICGDAVDWLRGQQAGGVGSIVTSLPDADETGQGFSQWQEWFKDTAALCIGATSDNAVTIFYQTDRKAEGRWISKAEMILSTVAPEAARVLWHKIALRAAPGAIDVRRPGYSHLIAISRQATPGKATADVLDRGRVLYPNGMGLKAASFAVRFAMRFSNDLVDPFCGRGTIPAVAEALGMNVTGIDIDPLQIEKARRLKLAFVNEESPA